MGKRNENGAIRYKVPLLLGRWTQKTGRRMTAKQFAEIIGVSGPTAALLMTGRPAVLRPEHVANMMAFFGLDDVGELIEYVEP